MARSVLVVMAAAFLASATLADAQTGDGSPGGFVKDDQGAVLPGTTVTATSAALLAPGIGSQNVDDGVGRRAYCFRGSHIYAHAFQLEGTPASAYIDSAAHSMGMGGDTVQVTLNYKF